MTRRKSPFDANTLLGEMLSRWWEELHGVGEFKDKKAQTAARAELRRAKTIEDIILLPAFQKACIRFKPFLPNSNEVLWETIGIERLALVLGLLSNVCESSEKDLPSQMTSQEKNEDPIVSAARFRRLVQRDGDDLYGAMLRTLAILKKKANIHYLANDMYYWGKDVKRNWILTYYPPIPERK